MDNRILSISAIAFLVMISSVGVGYAYVASIETNNSLDSYYCTVGADVGGGSILSISVIEIDSPTPTHYLGFSSNGTDFQETISLDYVHTRGTDIILTIEFSCTVESETPIIKCFLGEDVVGSTSLTGSGTKTGTISGIVLPVSENGTGTASFRFQVDGISLGTSVQMSFSVYPLEVSS